MKNLRAFTLIELLIVMTIMAILSVALAVSFSGANQKAAFDNQKLQLVNIIQTARSRALSNVLSEPTVAGGIGEPTEYYLLTITANSAKVESYYTDGTSETIDEFVFGSDYEAYNLTAGPLIGTTLMEVYYLSPGGEVCFGSDCPSQSDGSTERSISFRNKADTLSTKITVDLYGGFADVE